jgi:hypothetical protein
MSSRSPARARSLRLAEPALLDRVVELVMVVGAVRHAVAAHEHVKPQVDREDRVGVTEHRCRNVAVERERRNVLLGGRRVHERARRVHGAVDLEPVVAKREMAHDDLAVAHVGDERLVVQAPNAGRGMRNRRASSGG